jgi:translation initiation factor IF-3
MKELTINERIRDREVRLIGADGTQYGVISIAEARQIAEEQGFDLCKVSPDGATPATCKLMDYGKYRYEQQKREKEAKKNQKVIEIKEIRLSATIDIGDTTRLAAQTAKFLQEGNKVKASIRLKGRQQAHPDLAVDIINDYIEMVGECTVEKKPTQEGRNIFTILAPAKLSK